MSPFATLRPSRLAYSTEQASERAATDALLERLVSPVESTSAGC